MPAAAVPPGFRLVLDPGLRRPRPEVLVGGAPIRVLRLTAAGASLVDRWAAGAPVGPGPGAGRLAARLVDAGLAHPRPGAAPPLRATVVIPVRDDPAGLAATLASLADTAPGTPVVVVDDGSRPPVPASGPARVLRRSEAGGPASARNRGWRADGTGEVVVFVDAGCVLGEGWPAGLLGHFADPGLAAVAPRVTSRAQPATPAGLAAYEEAHSPLDMGPAEGPVRPGAAVPYLPTAVLAVRRAALDDVGGFDERLRFGEDVDLVWRLAGAGWRVRYAPDVAASHPGRSTWRGWLRQRYDYGRSAAPLAARHGRAAAPLTVSPWSVAVWASAAAGRPAPALALAAGSAAALARRAGPDRATAAELGRLALTGHVRAGRPIAGAVRRAWLPAAVPALVLAWRFGDRRARTALGSTLAAATLGEGIADWWVCRRPAGPLRWSAWRLADDLAYQAGVWAGVLKARSAQALLPRW
ncbi:MAG TPA: mycofactocin biosynthesis glycosyltransferase MftF [Acidimicrobiales bacterium]|nr:mycofactocin biosynthesis glycosyltransferase MftF [Acidimicrobiales bacterium]